MKGWGWLTSDEYRWGFLVRVVLKAGLLFLLANAAFALTYPAPLDALGRVSLYNTVLPGRERLPFGERPDSYNLSLNNWHAMFASHVVSAPKADDEFRVLVIGDSGTWGILLQPDETLTGQLNALDLTAPDGRNLRFYNLGYPIMSLTKDLTVLDYALRYDPDAVVWMVTLESFPYDQQLEPPPLQHDPRRVRALIARYDLAVNPDDPRFVEPSLLERTIVGQRRPLADLLRLQLYGFPYATTGVDQFYPEDYTLRAEDFEPDITWHGFDEPTTFTESDLAFDALRAGLQRADDLPVLVVNEPMFISDGENSDLRYNFFYPRWAYNAYRDLLATTAEAQGWHYLDLWDALPPGVFTDSAVHYTPEGAATLAGQVAHGVGGMLE